jgi:tyrosinase
MKVRKNALSLDATQQKALTDAFLALKKAGRYDQYVHWHHAVMQATVLPMEPAHPDYRNGAHRGPSFLPWHREFLLQVEADLQGINSAITIPFWDWTADAKLDDAHKSPLWTDAFLGGNGVESDDWRVGNGPFAYASGNWPIPIGHDGPALIRRFGYSVPNLPTTEDLALAMAEYVYDAPPYNGSPFALGFRNRIEGWITQRGDPHVKTSGSQLHNRVHLWVGGSMEPMTSPNDPVFFLHHCFIDKVWADWQAKQDADWKESGYDGTAPRYNPVSEGPLGHNLHDVLTPWSHQIVDVLDIAMLGYSYETASTHAEVMALARDFSAPVRPGRKLSPFATRDG